jgi:uncharacterized membrane protein
VTRPPDYVVHAVSERDVTVDWFFARGRARHRIRQLVLMAVGWVFAILPVVITASALLHRNRPGGWWSYPEGFYMWDVTTRTLAFLIGVFIVGFFALYVANRASARKRDQRTTYDAARLSRRLELAGDLYRSKYGDRAFRLERNKIVIEPYADVETYELRDRYRKYGVD